MGVHSHHHVVVGHRVVVHRHLLVLGHVVVHRRHPSEGTHWGLFDSYVSAQQLILVGDLGQEFLIQLYLLHQADDRLLVIVLVHSAQLDHFLLLLVLQVTLQVVFVHHLIRHRMVPHPIVQSVVVAFHSRHPVVHVAVKEVFVRGVPVVWSHSETLILLVSLHSTVHLLRYLRLGCLWLRLWGLIDQNI